MPFKPNRDRIIVERLDPITKTGNVLLALGSQTKSLEGKVVMAGEGEFNDDGDRMPMDVSVGDHVLFPAGAGTEIMLDGDDYLIMRQHEIYGTMIADDNSDDE